MCNTKKREEIAICKPYSEYIIHIVCKWQKKKTKCQIKKQSVCASGAYEMTKEFEYKIRNKNLNPNTLTNIAA